MKIRVMLADYAAHQVRESHRCAREATMMENDGLGRSYDCAHWWLGAVLHDFWARVFGYRGPTLEMQLGRPPRPRP